MADLDHYLPLVNVIYGLMDHTSGGVKVWSVTGGMDIAPSVLGKGISTRFT